MCKQVFDGEKMEIFWIVFCHDTFCIILDNYIKFYECWNFLYIFFSGGKDSCYNMMQCVMEGHQIVALANLKPENKGTNSK